MVFAAVGIKCPECAGQPTGVRGATTRARAVAGTGTGAVVTKALIALNVAVFLLQVTQSGDLLGVSGSAFHELALQGSAVASGEWWRLVTSAFLHIGPLHLALNMLGLWWFGSALETALGRARFLAVYAIATLAGSAGALLLTNPATETAGASGALFGVLGAGLFLERRRTYVFGGAAMAVVLFNLVFTFAGPLHVSIGGHLGGLAGGLAAAFVLSGFGRGHAAYQRLHAVEITALVLLAAISVALAYVRVRWYV